LQRIEFARTKSDAVAKLDGSYKPDKERKKKGEAARGECIVNMASRCCISTK